MPFQALNRLSFSEFLPTMKRQLNSLDHLSPYLLFIILTSFSRKSFMSAGASVSKCPQKLTTSIFFLLGENVPQTPS